MSAAEEILELLENAGGPVSGEEIAGKLGVSRNTVWKAVNRLKEQGYEIQAATNRGYCLISHRNALTPQSVRRLLEGSARRCAIDVRDSVTSTNTVVKGLAEQGGAEGMVLIAHQQTQGKGRLGRSFYSPKGTGLYLSVLLRPPFSRGGGSFHHHRRGGGCGPGGGRCHRKVCSDQMGQRRVLGRVEGLRYPHRSGGRF